MGRRPRSAPWSLLLVACTGCGAVFPTKLLPESDDASTSSGDAAAGVDASNEGHTDSMAGDAAPSGGDASDAGATGSCADGGACVPDAGPRSCGCGGTQSCGSDCLWQGCSMPDCASGVICNAGTCCSSPSVCAPGATQNVPCGNCGQQSETCDSCGQWGSPGACTGQTGCTIGSTQSCNTYGTQTCGSDCNWGACSCTPNPTCVPWSIAVTGQVPGDGPICTGTASGANCCVTAVPNACGSAGECCGNMGTVCDGCGQCGVMQCLCLC
jgi:hypothetical protein